MKIIMLDPHLLRNDLEAVGKALAKRGFELDTEQFQSLEWRRKKIQVATEKLQAKRNRHSKKIGQAKAAGEDIEPLLAEVASLGEKLKSRQADLDGVQEELHGFLREVPNIPHASVPAGDKEEDNKEIRRWGELSAMDFVPKDHTSLGEAPWG